MGTSRVSGGRRPKASGCGAARSGIANSAAGLSHASPSLRGHDNWLVAVEELYTWVALREEEPYGAAEGVPKHAKPTDNNETNTHRGNASTHARIDL